MKVIKLEHPTDARYLLIPGELPDRVTFDDLLSWRYGKPFLFEPFSHAGEPVVVYEREAVDGDWHSPTCPVHAELL